MKPPLSNLQAATMTMDVAILWRAQCLLPRCRQNRVAVASMQRQPPVYQRVAVGFPTSARRESFRRPVICRAVAPNRLYDFQTGKELGTVVEPPPRAWPVSVVIPVHNELPNLPLLVEKVGNVMTRRGGPYEILIIDDGSTDGSSKLLKAMAAERRDLRVIILERNFGQTAAMAAGFDNAAGKLVVTLDGDLQNDPEDIPKVINHLLYGDEQKTSAKTAPREGGGYDLVCGWRRSRKDPFFSRNLPSAIANRIISAVTGVKLHDFGCSLKGYRASLLANIKLYGELHRYIPALAAIEGASIAEIEVRHQGRAFGTSKYGIGRTPRVILDLVIVCFWAKFRDRPLQLIGLASIICLLASVCLAAVGGFSMYSASQFWGLEAAFQSSLPTLVLALELFVMGLQTMFLGLVAEICMRTYYESQPRPVYRVREVATSRFRTSG